MVSLELKDIQGYILNEYPQLIFSRFSFLKMGDARLAKEWLSNLFDKITNAEPNLAKETALNIAFTANGLKALEMNAQNINAFTTEFREGMVTDHRKRLLGDIDSSDPKLWQWGNAQNYISPSLESTNETIHLVIMVFGIDKTTCLEYFDKLKEDFTKLGLEEVNNIDGQTLENNKEHFGFKDGISQPIIKESGLPGNDRDMVPAGEFLMGYKNLYNVFPQTPLIQHEEGDLNLLAADAGDSGNKDLGRNGSYLVIRHMEQDVTAFWEFMNDSTRDEHGHIIAEESIRLASRMFGRWPGGAPLTKYPLQDPGIISTDNDFGYAQTDEDGLKCPFGSHIRRSNPRDSFEDIDSKESVRLSNRHRIIRRARPYGDPIIGSPTNHKPKGEVGILFNCFNADISRQFEFIQYTWSNIPKPKQLYNDPDPIIGVKEVPEPGVEQNFTIQMEPINMTVKGLKRFVRIRGGAYFFFPSISAIRYLSTI